MTLKIRPQMNPTLHHGHHIIFFVRRRTWEREGRPKLSLRRFFSAMGLNSMGKMVKGCRSSSMEQLSLSTARASPSPTHKSQTLLQRTPSLQALHTVSITTYISTLEIFSESQTLFQLKQHCSSFISTRSLLLLSCVKLLPYRACSPLRRNMSAQLFLESFICLLPWDPGLLGMC